MNNDEIERLLSDANKHAAFDAANFVDALPGSPWNLRDSKFGWRRQAQEWGTSEGLVEPKTREETNQTFIVLTDRGKAFKEALRARGITIFAKPHTDC